MGVGGIAPIKIILRVSGRLAALYGAAAAHRLAASSQVKACKLGAKNCCKDMAGALQVKLVTQYQLPPPIVVHCQACTTSLAIGCGEAPHSYSPMRSPRNTAANNQTYVGVVRQG